MSFDSSCGHFQKIQDLGNWDSLVLRFLLGGRDLGDC